MIELESVTLGYGRHTVSRDLTISIPPGALTMIVGPNGSGKSTALGAMAGLVRPNRGAVILNGTDLRLLRTRDLAQQLGLLAQQSSAPDGIRVAELVARGRYPHQRALSRWSEADEAAVEDALATTGLTAHSAAQVAELSGGQRQRVWIAMALAQDTPVLLLDEPTTFLDLAHQLDIMELCRDLVARGRTVVAVVHDLSQACRFADHLVVMRDGAVVAAGPPGGIVDATLVREVFDVEATVTRDATTGQPVVIPLRTVREEIAVRG